jgi:hypothetical protein
MSLRCQYRNIDLVMKALQFSHAGLFCEESPTVWIHAGGKKFAICLTHASTITDYEQRYRLVPTRFEQFAPITSSDRSGGCLRGGIRYKRHNRDENGLCKGCGKPSL